MKLVINDHRKIFAIQEDFNKLFPYLKLEFYSKPPGIGVGSSNKLVKRSSKTLGEYRIIYNKGKLTVTSQMTSSEIVENFRDIYGLTVKIFRKSGKAWLETTVTGKWTLEEQNLRGEELSKQK